MFLFSVYNSVASKEPRACSLQDIVAEVRAGSKAEGLTAAYRAGSLDAKRQLNAFCPAAVMQGGRALKCAQYLTGFSLVDFDHVSPEQLQAAREVLQKDAHTALVYVTPSGQGLRVLYRFLTPGGKWLFGQQFDGKQASKYYQKAFRVGNEYYARLTGLEADAQCSDFSRLSFISHDPAAYCNPLADPFTAEQIEASDRVLSQQKKAAARKTLSAKTAYEKYIRREVEKDGAQYAAGQHNDYVMRVGYKLNQLGMDQGEAEQWAAEEFSDYPEAARVIRSCYQTRASEHGTRKLGRKRETQKADPNELIQRLKEMVDVRRNVITRRYEYRLKDEDNWQLCTDALYNSLYNRVQQDMGERVQYADIPRALENLECPQHNPFAEYFDSLPQWDESQPDHIQELADTVEVAGGERVQSRWAQWLKKWLVAMVAAWFDDSVVNNAILVFIGAQGTYKTTWFNYLLPPPLRRYFRTKDNAQRLSKDDKLTLANTGLICCEELDTMTLADLNQLKAAVTMQYIDERAPYARFPEHMPHIASFCGTGNNLEFLTDRTGNRRWLPFETKHIRSPRDHPLNYAGIYAQAYHLWQQKFVYWFTRADMDEQNEHNAAFETASLEQDLCARYFRKPRSQTEAAFYTTGDVMQTISGGLAVKLSTVLVGRAMAALGFERKKANNVRGFIAYRMDDEERALQQRSAAAAEQLPQYNDSEKPF